MQAIRFNNTHHWPLYTYFLLKDNTKMSKSGARDEYDFRILEGLQTRAQCGRGMLMATDLLLEHAPWHRSSLHVVYIMIEAIIVQRTNDKQFQTNRQRRWILKIRS